MSFENGIKSGTLASLAIGVGMMVITPLVVPVLGKLARPAGRAAVRTGSMFYTKARETFSELGEVAEDFMAEARSEFDKSDEQGLPEDALAVQADAQAGPEAGQPEPRS